MQITINFKKIHLLVGTFLALTMAIIGLYTLDSNLLAIFVVIEIYLILLALFFFGISWINPQQPKQGENQLKSNSLYLANLFNQYSIFTESSIDGRIIYANENFIKCTGYSKNEILEMKYSFLQSGVHSSKFYADLWETVLAGNIWQGEICNKNKLGKFFWVYMTIIPQFDRSGKVFKFLSFMHEITQIKKMELEKEELERQLYHSQKLESIGQLTSGVAHDFNNILMAIIGFSDLGVALIEKNNYDKAIASFDKVRKSARRATDLVDKMLTFCSENTVSAEHPIRPATIVQEVVDISDMLRSGISTKIQVKFENNLYDNAIGILIGESELHQMTANLLINARDAIEITNKNNGFISVNLFLDAIDHPETCYACGKTFTGRYVNLSVSDNGSGISKEKIPKIFDPFFTTKEVGKGTGLGLSVVSGIMNHAKGHILVDSKLEEGTVISLLFPIIYMDNNKPDVSLTAKKEISRTKLKICVVDDENDILDLYSEQLTLLGYDVSCFNLPTSAWDKIHNNPDYFDVVISDYGMPEATGLDLANLILTIRPNIPILICTGYSDKLKSDKDLPIGNTFLFKKPVEIEQLHQIIQKFFLSI